MFIWNEFILLLVQCRNMVLPCTQWLTVFTAFVHIAPLFCGFRPHPVLILREYCGLLLNFLAKGSIPNWPKQNLLPLFFFLIHLFLLFPSHSLVLNMELFSQAADLCNLIWPQLLISREKGVCIWLCSLSLYKADTVWAAVSKYNLCCSMIPLCLNQ